MTHLQSNHPGPDCSESGTKVKICGITRTQDATQAAALGADFIGLNFWPRSKRFVELEVANQLAAAARAVNPSIKVIGVFVNPTDRELKAAQTAANLDLFQLHGDESVDRVAALGPRAFKATAVNSVASVSLALSYPGPWLLLDAPTAGYGGSGNAFDWHSVIGLDGSNRPWFLAGGLTPENVASAIAMVQPNAVDVASGVENAPGEKDESKMRAFIAAARRCTHARSGEPS